MTLFFIVFTGMTCAQAPFQRGVNLTNWFQTSSAEQSQFTKLVVMD